MAYESKETWYLDIVEKLDDFCRRVDEKIDKEQQQMKACKKKTELEMKLAQEMKLNNELNERLAELLRRGNELDRVCATFESHLSIADSDRNRLDNAKETYQLAKELTSIRWDFSAPPNVAKGYINYKIFEVANHIHHYLIDKTTNQNQHAVAIIDIKSESRKLLQPLELDMSTGGDTGALWTLLQTTVAPGWPSNTDKENKAHN